MFFSKITLRYDVNASKLSQLVREGFYHQHQYLWRLFGAESEEKRMRGFIYRHEEERGWPCFFVVSQHPPVDKEGLWNIDSKPYSPKLSSGQRLAFSLRANPVVTRKPAEPDPNPKKRKRHDVVMEAKSQLKAHRPSPEQWPPPQNIIEEAGWQWLDARADKHGFGVKREELRLDGYQQHQLLKRGKDPIHFSTLDFTGLLTVVECKKFLKALYEGIGPAKGFGCGLLLVRKI